MTATLLQPEIPRIIHQFWHLADPPADVGPSMRSWRERHPDWDYILWNDETAAAFLEEEFGPLAAACFRACVLPTMRSDIIRIAALLTLGGVYADADMLCIRPIGELITADLVLRFHRKMGRLKISGGFMAAKPGSMFLRLAMSRATRNVRKGRNSLDVSMLTGPWMLTEVWNRDLPDAQKREARLVDHDVLENFFTMPDQQSTQRDPDHWSNEIRRRRIIDAERFGPAEDR